jgi:hypothetical protein
MSFVDIVTTHLALNAIVTQGGSWWVSLSDVVPDNAVTIGSVTEPAGQTRAELQRVSAWWDTPADWAVQAANDLYLPAPTLDLGTVVAAIGWDAAIGGTPRIAWRLSTGFTVLAGSGTRIPKQSLRIT